MLAFETDRTRVEFRPITGRAHQIRLHAAHPTGLGHPILGDVLYGPVPGRADEARLMLHASRLSIEHPATGARMDFESPCPF